MKYVLDSSVAVKWVLKEQFSDKAQALRDDFARANHLLIAPDVFPVEVAHALSKAERQGRLASPQAAVLWMDVMASPPQFFPSVSLLPQALAIASRFRIGVYDCLYVALADSEKCPLITADDKLIKNLQSSYPYIVPLPSLP